MKATTSHPRSDDPRQQTGYQDLPLFRGRPAPATIEAALAAPPSTPACDADTSLEAAQYQARSGRATTDEGRVYEALSALPDTDDGLEVRLAMRHQTCSARRRGLVLKGLVGWTGDYGKTRSGRRARIWGVLR